ncbi:hypothetical protein DL95DRAFT_116082 [Leptodontidium sp. 2 PMI_412]|nr:hypothetical protein DL95DRAFT_116082 [Leptodontidium sp. 2 PMI_412]
MFSSVHPSSPLPDDLGREWSADSTDVLRAILPTPCWKFTAGFDALVDIPGVWDGMRLTTLQKMMAMGCRDECLSYLRRIKEVFTGLVGKDVLGRIDTATVKALERRAPGVSTKDLSELREGKIFSAFSHRERDMTWERLKMMDGHVPTLFTFFRDIQYLKLCIDCLKSLVIVPKRETICGTLARSYSDTNEREGYVKIQITEHTFLDRAGTPADSTGLGIRQLVALAMRHYPAMPADTVKEDPVQTALPMRTLLCCAASLILHMIILNPCLEGVSEPEVCAT